MLTDPLPSQIDIRKLVIKGVEISALAPVSTLPRIADMLATDQGSLAVKLQFYRDEQRFRRVDGQISGTVDMFCQRCLEPMPVAIDSQFALAIVWSEEDAERLPKSLEPLIVGEELTDLADIISEELILHLPFVSYHPVDECKREAGFTSVDADAAAAVAVDDSKTSPFNVLEQLKFDK